MCQSSRLSPTRAGGSQTGCRQSSGLSCAPRQPGASLETNQTLSKPCGVWICQRINTKTARVLKRFENSSKHTLKSHKFLNTPT